MAQQRSCAFLSPYQTNCSLLSPSRERSQKVKAFVAKVEWLDLQHLAPYSPAYNPIERFWRWLKSKVYGCKSYKTMDGMISKIRKLIWHYNEGRLVATIRFHFSAYVEIL